MAKKDLGLIQDNPHGFNSSSPEKC